MKKLILAPLIVMFLVPAAAHGAELYVAPGGDDVANDCQTEVSPCLTIGHAVTQAADNDRINLAAGDYFEQIDLSGIGSNNLTIEGDSPAATSIKVGAPGTEWADLSDFGGASKPIIRLGADTVGTVTIRGLSIDGQSIQPACDAPGYKQFHGIYTAGKSLSLDSSIITGINKVDATIAPTSGCVELSGPLYATASDSGEERIINLENSFFNNFLNIGAVVSGSDWSLTADNVNITGRRDDPLRPQMGFFIGESPLTASSGTPQSVVIENGNISDMFYNSYDPLDPFTISAGIFYKRDAVAKDITVQSMTFLDIDGGVYLQGQVGSLVERRSSITQSTFNGPYIFGVVVDGGLAEISENTFSPSGTIVTTDPQRAISLIASATPPATAEDLDVRIMSNRFQNGGSNKRAISVETSPPLNVASAVSLLARENSFLGYLPAYEVGGTTITPSVDLEKNWWGCNGGPLGGTGCSSVASGVSVPSWLQFGLGAKPTKLLLPGGESEITASLRNSGGTGDGSLAADFPAATVSSLASDLGTLSDSSLPLSGGQAATTLTRGAENGLATVSGTLDGVEAEVEVGFYQALENTTPPAISGSGLAEQELLATPGAWTGDPAPTFTYQWQIANSQTGPWQNLAGATTTSYTPTSEQAGKFLRIRVLATSPAGNQPALSAPFALLNSAPSELLPPRVYGVPQLGNTLQGFPGVWTSRDSLSFTYQWQRTLDPLADWEDIEGAEEANYTVSSEDRGGFLRLRVSAGGSGGQASAASPEVAVFAFGVGARKLVSGRPVSVGLGTVPVAEISCLQEECQIEKATLSLRARKKKVAGGKIIFEGGAWSSGKKTLSLEAPRALLQRLRARKSGLLEVDIKVISSNGSVLERNMRFGLRR